MSFRRQPKNSFLRSLWPSRSRRRIRRTDAAFGLESLEHRFALAASPLANINPGANSGFPGNSFSGYPAFTEAAGTTFFFSTHATLGRELWKTDGTTAGTVVVKDINPGAGSGDDFVGQIAAFNGKAYFRAFDGANVRLWCSDGTPSGTTAVNLSQTVFNPFSLTVVGSSLYYAATDNGGNWGLYMLSTAQPSNQTRLYDFGNQMPTELKAFGNSLYFQGWSVNEGSELWTSNGTVEGTRRLHDVNPGVVSSFPAALTPFGGFLYFVATNNNEGRELYRTTGVVGSLPQLVSRAGITGINANAADAFGNAYLMPFNSRLYFAASGGAGLGGTELWRTTGDGSVAERVSDLNSGAGDSFPAELTVFNGSLFFTGTDDGVNTKLFRTGGNLNDVQIVQFGSVSNVNPTPTYLAVAGNRLLVNARGSSTGSDFELWSVASGVATSATIVKNINPTAASFPGAITPNRGGTRAFFQADNGVNGTELWVTDGTDAGTQLVRDTNDSSASGALSRMITFAGQVFFAANDNKGGPNYELWQTDGTPAGTKLQSDLWEGGSSQPDDFTIVGNSLYLTARTAAGRYDIFKLDADKLGQKPVSVTTNGFAQRPTRLAAFKDRLVFSASNGANQVLWTTDRDGNPANTSAWGNGIVDPRSMREFNGNLYFTAMVGGNRRLCYMNDAADPSIKVETGISDVQDGLLPVLAGNLYFVGTGNDGRGRELWRHDGNFATRVGDVNPFGGDAFPAATPFLDWTIYKNRLYFIADGGPGIGVELYRTTANGQGVEAVVDGGGVNKTVAPAGSEDGFSYGLPPCFAQTTDGWLYFEATNGVNGYELWRTDGTDANTKMVKNINTTLLSGPTNLTAVGTRVYFSSIGDTGDELWVSDGTEAGTTLVQDIAYGGPDGSPYSSAPRGGSGGDYRAPYAVLQPVGGNARMVFWADDNVAGREPWALEIDTTPPTIAITAAPTSVIAGGTSTITFTLSEPSTTFVTSDVSVTGGTISPLSGSGARYTAVFTPQAAFTGTARVSVAAAAFTDAAGNPNAVGASLSLTVDTGRPTISITAAPTSVVAGGTSTITFTLSEPSATFVTSDVSVVGGTISPLSGTGARYTAVFTPQAGFTGNATVSVAAGAFTDAAGNTNGSGASTTLTVTPSFNVVADPGFPASVGAFYGNRGQFVGDVNRDGRVDLISWNDGAKWVALAKASGDGFDAPRPWGTSNDPFVGTIANLVADVNADGYADLVAWNRDSVFVMVGSASGFSRPTLFSAGLFYGQRGNYLADVNRDGLVDLVAWNNGAKWVALAKSTKDGFQSPIPWGTSNDPFYGTLTDAVADVNGDGFADLVAWNADSVFVMVGSAAGFSRPTLFKAGTFYGSGGNFLADVNGDRKADLVAWNRDSKFVALAKQDGTGFMDASLLQSGVFDAARARLLGDFDGDGDADLIAWNNDSVFVSRVRPRIV